MRQSLSLVALDLSPMPTPKSKAHFGQTFTNRGVGKIRPKLSKYIVIL